MVNKVKISIVLPVLNGVSNYLKETLKAVLGQRMGHKFEIIVIDSGSTDGTVEFIKEIQGIRLYKIPNSEFNHGRTRQYGAELAKGDYIVYLSQDATPRDSQWLENLIDNFKDPEVVGVCSRVVPRREACLLKKIEVYHDLVGRKRKIVAKIENLREFKKLPFIKKRKRYYFFNDVSSAVRREFIIKNPLKTVFFGEDIEFAKDALRKRKKVVFEPKSMVYHSHDYSIFSTYRRNILDARYHRKYLNVVNVPNLFSVFVNAFNQFRKDIRSIKYFKGSIREKIKSLLYSPIIHLAEQLGQYKGAKK